MTAPKLTEAQRRAGIRKALRKLEKEWPHDPGSTCEPCGECDWCASRFEAIRILRSLTEAGRKAVSDGK